MRVRLDGGAGAQRDLEPIFIGCEHRPVGVHVGCVAVRVGGGQVVVVFEVVFGADAARSTDAAVVVGAVDVGVEVVVGPVRAVDLVGCRARRVGGAVGIGAVGSPVAVVVEPVGARQFAAEFAAGAAVAVDIEAVGQRVEVVVGAIVADLGLGAREQHFGDPRKPVEAVDREVDGFAGRKRHEQAHLGPAEAVRVVAGLAKGEHVQAGDAGAALAEEHRGVGAGRVAEHGLGTRHGQVGQAVVGVEYVGRRRPGGVDKQFGAAHQVGGLARARDGAFGRKGALGVGTVDERVGVVVDPIRARLGARGVVAAVGVEAVGKAVAVVVAAVAAEFDERAREGQRVRPGGPVVALDRHIVGVACRHVGEGRRRDVAERHAAGGVAGPGVGRFQNENIEIDANGRRERGRDHRVFGRGEAVEELGPRFGPGAARVGRKPRGRAARVAHHGVAALHFGDAGAALVDVRATRSGARVERAEVVVVAPGGLGRVDACAGEPVARVLGAGDAVVAVARAARAGRGRAAVVDRARVAVVAGVGVGGVLAAKPRVAAIVGAVVRVVAAEFAAGRTDAIGAAVVERADVAVVAEQGVLRVDTAALGIAGIGGAQVLIVAVDGGAATLAAGAAVVAGAGVAIVAGGYVRREDAAERRVAAVVGARVVVDAARRRAHADAGLAMVARGAQRRVVAQRAAGDGGLRAEPARRDARVA